MIEINQPGHAPQCKNHPPIQSCNISKQFGTRWITVWSEGCPHRKNGGNAIKWGWNCDGCMWNDGVNND